VKRPAAATAACILLGVLAGGAYAVAPELVSSPTISGITMEGETLQAHNGTYGGAEPPFSFAHEWQRCNGGGGDCVSLGVRGSSYTLTAGDIGSRIRVWEEATGQDCAEWNYSNMTRECRPVTVGVPSELTAVVDSNPKFLPNATAPPTVSGTPEEGEQLRADDGDWTGLEPIALLRQWERCSAAGDGCQAIPDAVAETYTLSAREVGSTIRLVVTGKNARGVSAPVPSEVTGLVLPLRPRPGRTAIDAAKVARPHRLVIDRFSFEPVPVRSRARVTLRVRISDTRGFRVRGAVVHVAAVRAGLIGAVPDARTGPDGWATLRVRPSAGVVYRAGASIELVVSAFATAEGTLGGVSARRRIALPLGAPRG
jgi:hypothetical protein